MNRVIINIDALRHNVGVVSRWMKERNLEWTAVVKVLCGHKPTLAAMHHMGVNSLGDSRLVNLEALAAVAPDVERWYMRVPALSSASEVVRLSSVSLNSETCVIEALNVEAKRLDKLHRIIIMIELGDLREGVLPAKLVRFYERVFELPNIEVRGIGTNLGCLAGSLPTTDQLMQLLLYRELLELKFGRKLPLVSAGSSAVLPMVMSGQLPTGINHFRIGETLFLGTDLIHGGTLPELRDDVILLEAEIAEIKEKSLNPPGEAMSISPFAAKEESGDEQKNEDTSPGQRGFRALVSVGHLDADVDGLRPVDPDLQIAGASSDLTVVNIGESTRGLQVGGAITFHMNYAALLRLMSSRYIVKETVSSQPLDDNPASLPQQQGA